MQITDEFLDKLPTGPGVYIMKDAEDRILYVGKAINLRSRVRSYFRDGGDGRFIIPFLRGKVHTIETVLTTSEKDALLLENTLIKKHKPRYNIRLRDDKTYISLRLDTTHEWPRIHRVRRRKRGDKALYFGPYSSSKSVNETIRFLQRLFPIRSCTDYELTTRTRPCILHQIERCSAPCVGKMDHATYQEYVAQSLLFLRGHKDEVVRLLTEKMHEFSEDMQFEKAALVRDRIRAIEQTIEKATVHSHRAFNRDVIGVARAGGRIVFAVLNFERGRLNNSETFKVRDTDLDDAQVLEGFLTQYYDMGRTVPADVLVPREPTNLALLTKTLAETRGGPVHVRVPQRGEKKRLLEMAQRNAEDMLDRTLAGAKTMEETLDNLRVSLHLDRLPRHIECFDISNFQGSFPVGSMVCFRDGEPDKSGYRRFQIKTIDGQNDFAMMQEILTRRYRRIASGEEPPPDLIVIDGGKGQLGIAIEVLRGLELAGKIPVVGLAKARLKSRDGEHIRTEERVFLPLRKNPVTFTRSDPALHLLERLRDETHRFGVTYHRHLRNKSALKTGLEEIPAVGPKRRALLLKHFGSLARVKRATLDDLRSVNGLGEQAARHVHAFFHPEKSESENE